MITLKGRGFARSSGEIQTQPIQPRPFEANSMPPTHESGNGGVDLVQAIQEVRHQLFLS
jgi:hypothetical protein